MRARGSAPRDPSASFGYRLLERNRLAALLVAAALGLTIVDALEAFGQGGFPDCIYTAVGDVAACTQTASDPE